MTPGKELLYLSLADVEKINLSMGEIIETLEQAFTEKFYGRVEMPPKPGIHTRDDAFIHAMPCWVPASDAAGIKWIAGYPSNKDQGLPYITGLIIMNDPETGLPVAVMDATWITAMRTGAVTGLSAKFLANPASESIGIIGCGVQGRANLRALLVVCKNIKRVYAYDHRMENTLNFIQSQKELYDVEFIPAAMPMEAVVDSDILVTSGPIRHDPERVIEAGWIKKGALLAPVDFDCMFKPGVLEQIPSKWFVDDIGQYNHFKSMGYFPYGPGTLPEICTVIAKQDPGRTNAEEIIATINIGMALDDIPTAAKVLLKAQEKGLGILLPL